MYGGPALMTGPVGFWMARTRWPRCPSHSPPPELVLFGGLGRRHHNSS